MIFVNGKVWGSTYNIFNKNNVEIHRLEINKDGFCSKHTHKHKFNMFVIEKGKLKVDIWRNEYDLVDSTILSDKMATTVKPGEEHMFTAIEDTIAYEIYWVELETEDIERKNVGGVNVK